MMRSSVLRSVVSFVALFSTVYGGPKNLLVPPPLRSDEIAQSVGLSRVASTSTTANGTSTFQQYIDHNNPALGTFSQQFWWNAQYWKGPGSPVSIATGDERACS